MKLSLRRRICLALILSFLLSGLLGYEAAVCANEPEPVSTDSSQQKETSEFGKLAKKFVILVGELPVFHSNEEIDRIVGDPWTLSATTSAKIGLLPPQMRLRLYSAIAERVSMMQMERSDTSRVRESQSTSSVVLSLSSKDAEQMVSRFVNSISGYFSVEELTDLGVFLAAQTPLFPKEASGWGRLKRGVAENAVLIAIAALAGELVLNQGDIALSGWFMKLSKDSYRLGWYGSVSNFGIEKNPRLKGGVALTTDGFELLAGANEKVNPIPTEEKHVLEVQLREHWLAALGKQRGWDLSAAARVKYVLEYGNPTEKQAVISSLELFARKNKVFDDPLVAFLLNTSFSTDFFRRASGSLSVGLEDQRRDLILAIRASFSEDKLANSSSEANHYSLGLYASGRLGRSQSRLWGQMVSKSQDVLNTLALVHLIVPKRDDILDRLNTIGTREEKFKDDICLISKLEEVEKQLFEIQTQLASDLKEYQHSRTEYFQEKGAPSESLRITDGPLSSKDFFEVLEALDFSGALNTGANMNP
ncbi:hypothetical protein WDW86_14545 [Bdellovibrionota bacterium FG-2]